MKNNDLIRVIFFSIVMVKVETAVQSQLTQRMRLNQRALSRAHGGSQIGLSTIVGMLRSAAQRIMNNRQERQGPPRED
ncbi:MAG: hypothetical protein NTU47_14260 [Ignavibacteriales bacterium]|nr:hypothetical protein [Ignavibacteriales bacterium]